VAELRYGARPGGHHTDGCLEIHRHIADAGSGDLDWRTTQPRRAALPRRLCAVLRRRGDEELAQRRVASLVRVHREAHRRHAHRFLLSRYSWCNCWAVGAAGKREGDWKPLELTIGRLRWKGEEFGIYLPGRDPVDAMGKRCTGHNLWLGFSLGP
jgi:hypothetical protein